MDCLSKRVRFLIERDRRVCWLCALVILVDVERNHPCAASADHVVERRNGGSSGYSNLRLAHRFCNSVRKQFPDPRTHPRWKDSIFTPLAKLGLSNEQSLFSECDLHEVYALLPKLSERVELIRDHVDAVAEHLEQQVGRYIMCQDMAKIVRHFYHDLESALLDEPLYVERTKKDGPLPEPLPQNDDGSPDLTDEYKRLEEAS